MTAIARRDHYTDEDLDAFPEDDGRRYELFDGELVVSAQPTTLHQRAINRLFRELDAYVTAGDLGEVFAATPEVRLRPGRILVPDLVFVSRARAGIVRERRIEGAPELVVEVLSPSTRTRDLGRKKDYYEQAGVTEYWAVDLAARTILVFVLNEGRYVPLPPAEGRFRSRLFPDLALDLDALCAGLGGVAAPQETQ